ncbi:MAG: YdeI/OmpD-associated family protein [Bacteroidia bacterium]|nr:YdeI/OmpD-associated family protein [Bacteroidia bacterium]
MNQTFLPGRSVFPSRNIIHRPSDLMGDAFILKKFSSGMHYIVLDPITASYFTAQETRRVVCRLNDQITFHCAIMPKKEGGYFINIGSAICQKLNLQEGAEVTATFTADTSEYQFTMPDELKEVLNTDPEADAAFHRLTAGNQRGLIYLVTQVKSSSNRIERALRIAAQLKNGITSPRIILK